MDLRPVWPTDAESVSIPAHELGRDMVGKVAGILGVENATTVAAAYDAALGIISLGAPGLAPSENARAGMIDAMIGHAMENGFDRDRLVLVALAAYPAPRPSENIAASARSP